MFNQKEWIEHDYNPFILYSDSGKVLYVNTVAELLISYVDKKIFYDLSLSYASASFGYKTTFINLEYDKFNFFAITVGYEDDNQVGIKLYSNPQIQNTKSVKTNTCNELGNIYILIDLSISLACANNDIIYKKEFDPTIPEFKLPQNEFTKILRKAYNLFNTSSIITTTLKLKIGEFIKIDNNKYQIIELSIKGNQKTLLQDTTLLEMSKNINIQCSCLKNKLLLDIPVIV